MIRRDGYVKLLDFGVAQLVECHEDAGFAAARFGTLHYLAPEILGGAEAGARSDLFSLGVVLYEMLAGQPPFDGSTADEVRRSMVEDRPAPLTRFNPDVPTGLRRAIGRCLARDPEDRYHSASHLLAELKQLRSEYEARTLRRRVTDPLGRPDESRASGEYRFGGYGKRRPLRALIAAAVLAVVTMGLVGWLFMQRHDFDRHDSIAVLPFVNETGNPRYQYMAEGLTDALIQQLSYLSGLRVMARGSVYKYQGAPYDPRKAGHELDVDTVLAGRILSSGGDVIVAAELLDVVEGTRLWSGRYRHVTENLAEIELSMAEEIANQLSAELRDGVAAEGNSEAHRLYLQGRYHWNRRSSGDLDRAVELFRQAIDKDPLYAKAYAGLADTWNLIGSYGDRPPSDSFPRARAAALRALELDPGLAEAHTSLAYAVQNYDWDWVRAEREYRRAIALSPSYATAHHWYGGFLMLMGRFDEAVEHRKMAVEHDPLSPQIQASIGSPYFLARDYDQAIALFRRAIEMDPNYAQGHYALGWSLLHSGRVDEGVQHLEIRNELAGQSADSLADLAYAYALAGRREEAVAVRDKLLLATRTRYISPYKFARIALAFGDHDEAFRLIGEAYRQRSNYLTGIATDPTLDPIRSDPRFLDLLRNMKLSDVAREIEARATDTAPMSRH